LAFFAVKDPKRVKLATQLTILTKIIKMILKKGYKFQAKGSSTSSASDRVKVNLKPLKPQTP
jgi:hypothetical protein